MLSPWPANYHHLLLLLLLLCGLSLLLALPSLAQVQQGDKGTYSAPITSSPLSSTDPNTLSSAEEDGNNKTQSFTLSFLMILASEIGDKTFIIAAIYAMRHPKAIIFTAGASALAIMSVLSAVLGHIVPELLPKWIVAYLASALFLIFGAKMVQEGHQMTPADESGEYEEVKAELDSVDQEHELRAMEGGAGSGSLMMMDEEDDDALKAEGIQDYATRQRAKGASLGLSPSLPRSFYLQVRSLLGLIFSPIFLQTFVLIFLAEWGDRSQIATIALAASQDMFWVILGTVSGHAVCTGAAVLGGSMLAERISVRTVMMAGGVLFLLFGFVYLNEALIE
ncbi:MAG: transmembrane protein-like protein [Piptocephalis tieghemiana]|nr:MAG: transmembrane protein-like protein [Piptocephalis tieghemiana]